MKMIQYSPVVECDETRQERAAGDQTEDDGSDDAAAEGEADLVILVLLLHFHADFLALGLLDVELQTNHRRSFHNHGEGPY